jgi:cytochrome c oxidase cbb3-type subunit III
VTGARLGWAIVALGWVVALASCDTIPGQPSRSSEATAPGEVVAFRPLYSANCAGCHGSQGRGGAALGLADPVYLAIAGDAEIRRAVANGVRGTTMPAFARAAGGLLSDAQIDAITKGIRSWSRPSALDHAQPPPYSSRVPGSSERGAVAFGVFCASCHGARGEGTAKASAIADDSYLALVSDQGLRTLTITGRPELGAPDWRGNVIGRAMSDEEVTDVVAWLASRRAQYPGRPYPKEATLR